MILTFTPSKYVMTKHVITPSLVLSANRLQPRRYIGKVDWLQDSFFFWNSLSLEDMDFSKRLLRFPDEQDEQSWDLVYHRSPTPPRMDFFDDRELVYNPFFQIKSPTLNEVIEILSSPEVKISPAPENSSEQVIEIFSSPEIIDICSPPEVEILPTPKKTPPETIDLVSPLQNISTNKRKNEDLKSIRRRLSFSSDDDSDEDSPGRLFICDKVTRKNNSDDDSDEDSPGRLFICAKVTRKN